jgi:hypothetical protein
MNFSIVEEEIIGNPRQPPLCLLVLISKRLLAEIAAGHHQSQKPPLLSLIREQKVMERGVGKEYPQESIVRSHLLGDGRKGTFAEQDNGPSGLLKKHLLLLAQLAEFPDRGHIFGHDRQGLLLSALASPKTDHRLGIRSIYREMVPAQSLDGQYPPLLEEIISLPDTISACRRTLLQAQLRTTIPTSIRLGVKSSVPRVFVFGTAKGAHGKPLHSSTLPIVRDILNDAVPRSAVRAIQERIAKPPVLVREKLKETLGASGYIG